MEEGKMGSRYDRQTEIDNLKITLLIFVYLFDYP